MRAVVSLGAAIAIGLGAATPAAATNQALMINGIGFGAALPDIVMSGVLGGMFADYDRHNIDWPQQARPVIGLRYSLAESIGIGADNLDAAIRQALTRIGPGEHVTVVGLSAGSLVADEEMRRLAADPTFDPGKLNFVVVGDSSRMALNNNRRDPFLRYTYAAPVDSIYHTTTVTAMYDGFADFPSTMGNVLAVANAIAGEMISHVPSMFTDLSTVRAGDITTTTNSVGGLRTDYVITPKHLPLVQVMPLLGLFGESALKAVIDSAYTRHELSGAHAKTAAAAPSSTAVPATAMPAASDTPEVLSAVAATVPAVAPSPPRPVAPTVAVREADPVVTPEPDAPAPVAGEHRGGHMAGPGAKAAGGQKNSDSPRSARGHRGA